jgi:hypothetical protein
MHRRTASPIKVTSENNPTPLVSSSAASVAAIPNSAPVVMTVAQVAAYLQVPVTSIYEKTRYRGRNRRLLPCRRVGKYLRFVFSEVQDYLLSLPLETHPAKRSYRKRSTQQVTK